MDTVPFQIRFRYSGTYYGESIRSYSWLLNLEVCYR